MSGGGQQTREGEAVAIMDKKRREMVKGRRRKNKGCRGTESKMNYFDDID